MPCAQLSLTVPAAGTYPGDEAGEGTSLYCDTEDESDWSFAEDRSNVAQSSNVSALLVAAAVLEATYSYEAAVSDRQTT